MKRVVITGPTGTIGISIINRMIEKGIEVLAICNPTSLRINRIPQSPLVKIVKCDLNDFSKLATNEWEQLRCFLHLLERTLGIREMCLCSKSKYKKCSGCGRIGKKIGMSYFYWGRFTGRVWTGQRHVDSRNPRYARKWVWHSKIMCRNDDSFKM